MSSESRSEGSLAPIEGCDETTPSPCLQPRELVAQGVAYCCHPVSCGCSHPIVKPETEETEICRHCGNTIPLGEPCWECAFTQEVGRERKCAECGHQHKWRCAQCDCVASSSVPARATRPTIAEMLASVPEVDDDDDVGNAPGVRMDDALRAKRDVRFNSFETCRRCRKFLFGPRAGCCCQNPLRAGRIEMPDSPEKVIARLREIIELQGPKFRLDQAPWLFVEMMKCEPWMLRALHEAYGQDNR